MTLETPRLLLRPWEETDAQDLFESAKDPQVGPIAGWPAHKTVQDSLDTIRTVFSVPYVFAVVPKEVEKPVGAISLQLGKNSNFPLPDTEGEIGYWIGVPYWGHGYIPEAVKELLRWGFADLHLDKIWCGYLKATKNPGGFRKNAALPTTTPTKTSFGPLPGRPKPNTSPASPGRTGRRASPKPAPHTKRTKETLCIPKTYFPAPTPPFP